MRSGFPGRMSATAGGVSFTPKNISGLQLWLDAADTSSSNIIQSGGAVSQWSDKSGNGNHATQGTASAKPTTNSATIGGKNALSFDGGDYLSITDSASVSLTGDSTFIFVGNCTNTTGTARNYLAKGSTTSYRLRLEQTTDFSWILLNSGDGFETTTSTQAVDLATDVILTTRVNIGSSIDFKRDGGSIGSPSSAEPSIANTADALLVGSADGAMEFWLGTMGEILVFDRALSNTELDQIEQYLSNKWGIGLALEPKKISNLFAWYDAADTSTITASSGQVSAWADKSGNGYNATEATNKPTTVSSVQNNMSVVRFTNDKMSLSTGVYTLSTGNNTLFAVSKNNNTINDTFPVITMASSNNSYYTLSYQFILGTAFFQNSTAGSSANKSLGGTGFKYITGQRNGSNQSIRINGSTAITSTSASSPAGIDSATLGQVTGTGSDFDLAELILYDRALSEGEIARIEKYLKNRWNITS